MDWISLAQVQGHCTLPLNVDLLNDLFRFIAFVFSAFTVLVATGQEIGYCDNLYITNGVVRTLDATHESGLVFIAGNFSEVGPNEAYGTVISPTFVSPELHFDNPNGIVYAAQSDGAGGWYLGGDFTAVGGIPRNRLAHVNASGEVTDWNPDVNGTVRVIALTDTLVYIGGDFGQVAGQDRSRLACVHRISGTLTDWNPQANGRVRALLVNDDEVYVAGQFTQLGDSLRNYAASVAQGSGEITSWNPNPNNTVHALAQTDTLLFIGGSFTQINGSNRNALAAFSLSDGAYLPSWYANGSGTVNALLVTDGLLYVGGNFQSFASSNSSSIVAIDIATRTKANDGSGPGGTIHSIVKVGNEILVGGDIVAYNVSGRNHLRKFDALDVGSSLWNAYCNGVVHALAVSGNRVFVGGEFTTIGGDSRTNIAAFDPETGQLDDFDPTVYGTIHQIDARGNYLFVAGDFSAVDNWFSSGIGSIYLPTNSANSFFDADLGIVKRFAIAGNAIYVVAGSGSTPLRAIHRNSGEHIASWTPPQLQGYPSYTAIAANSNAVFVAVNNSTFFPIGGRLRAFDGVSGELLEGWDIEVNGMIETLHLAGDTLYVGGDFSLIDGEARHSLAAFNATTGALTDWAPQANFRVEVFDVVDEVVYVGGAFTLVNGEPRQRLAAINALTGELTDWNPGANNTVLTIDVNPNYAVIGGEFSQVGSSECSRFAMIDACQTPPAPQFENPQVVICPGTPTTLSISVGSLYSAENWYWYTAECGGILAGIGTSIEVAPETGTSYFVRAEGGCSTYGACGEVQVLTSTPDVHSACGSFTWIDGITYSESNYTAQYTVPGGSVNGCDSVLTLHLTITGSIDPCGECLEGGPQNPNWGQSCADCNGTPNGNASFDSCGVCTGGATGLQPCTPCLTDITGDGLVNIDDLSLLLSQLGCNDGCSLDFNEDGLVDIGDLSLFLQEYGSDCDQ